MFGLMLEVFQKFKKFIQKSVCFNTRTSFSKFEEIIQSTFRFVAKTRCDVFQRTLWGKNSQIAVNKKLFEVLKESTKQSKKKSKHIFNLRIFIEHIPWLN